jgi:hypothetical protein
MKKIEDHQIDELASLFDNHLLAEFKAAANTSINVMDLDDSLTEYSFGGTFWDGYSHRIIKLGEKGGPLENRVTFHSSDLIIKTDNLNFRCHRVEQNSGLPKGGWSTKKSVLAKPTTDTLLLPNDEIQQLFYDKGNIIIGLTIDTINGLISADINWIYHNYDKKRHPLSCIRVRNLYTNSELPEIEEKPKSTTTNSSVLEKIEIDVKIQNE